MFEDFQPNPQAHRAARRRFQVSLTAATLIFGVSTAAAISATSAVRAPVEEEDLTQVVFKPAPPEPPAPLAEPPAPLPVVEAPKPIEKPKQPKKLKTPTQISDKVLPESDRPLSEAAAVGPVDGIAGGTGVAPARPAPPPPPPPPPVVKPPKPQPIVLPVALSTPQPKYSAMARRKGIEGVVVVEFDVLENGSVANLKIVSGAPELWETVMKTVGSWRYKSASRGGHPVRYRVKQRVIFSLQGS